jgi:protein-L-isoaspartate(D-aspartate) O-methyltransferase
MESMNLGITHAEDEMALRSKGIWGLLAGAAVGALVCCDRPAEPDLSGAAAPALEIATGSGEGAMGSDSFDEMSRLRNALVDGMSRHELRDRISDPRVVAAMRTVPRHEFVLHEYLDRAYDDRPLPIGHGVTISQPYVVALMTQLLEVGTNHRVLEIGTGSGYQAAVLAELTPEVYSIEIIEPLGREAAGRLERLGYDTVRVRIGDGYAGWPEHAPFDRIIITAAPPEIPQPLIDQLAPGGRIVAPVGRTGFDQWLVVVDKDSHGNIRERRDIPVRFVPMTGEALER